MKPLLVTEHLWQALVPRKAHQRAFLVQPGSTRPAIEMHGAWNWHWPLLTSIRLLSLQSYQYQINPTIKVTATTMGDEPIVAVTKDLRLIKVQATIQLQVNPDISIEILARINKHFINRVLRPIIRQSIRLVLAEQSDKNLQVSANLDQRILALLQPTLTDQGFTIKQLHITQLIAFYPSIPNSPIQS
jgi:regulator of protease activity HflC (stomatin/prohibitin superfamily)